MQKFAAKPTEELLKTTLKERLPKKGGLHKAFERLPQEHKRYAAFCLAGDEELLDAMAYGSSEDKNLAEEIDALRNARNGGVPAGHLAAAVHQVNLAYADKKNVLMKKVFEHKEHGLETYKAAVNALAYAYHKKTAEQEHIVNAVNAMEKTARKNTRLENKMLEKGTFMENVTGLTEAQKYGEHAEAAMKAFETAKNDELLRNFGRTVYHYAKLSSELGEKQGKTLACLTGEKTLAALVHPEYAEFKKRIRKILGSVNELSWQIDAPVNVAYALDRLQENNALTKEGIDALKTRLEKIAGFTGRPAGVNQIKQELANAITDSRQPLQLLLEEMNAGKPAQTGEDLSDDILCGLPRLMARMAAVSFAGYVRIVKESG